MSQGTVIVATTLTDSNGLYESTNLEPGSYTLTEETNPVGYYDKNISDGDTSPDGDSTDSDLTPDNKISVVLQPSEIDKNNDFVDSNKGSISGSVTDDADKPLVGVVLELKQGTTTVATTSTNPDGTYTFPNVVPGVYTVIETNPTGYPSNVRDYDTIPDGDGGDTDTTPDNSILVTLEPSEEDKETQPKDYPKSVSDYDEDPDLDPFDTDKVLDDKINHSYYLCNYICQDCRWMVNILLYTRPEG